MGRTRTKKAGSKTKEQSGPNGTSSKQPPSTESLLIKAQELIVQCDYELALKFVHRILDQDPKNVEAKEMLGVALLETGNIDAAKEVLYFSHTYRSFSQCMS